MQRHRLPWVGVAWFVATLLSYPGTFAQTPTAGPVVTVVVPPLLPTDTVPSIAIPTPTPVPPWVIPVPLPPTLPIPPAPYDPPVVVLPTPVTQPIQTLVYDVRWDTANAAITSWRPRGSFPARLLNMSVRAETGFGREPLLAGATISGPAPLPTLVRAIGPGLVRFGISRYADEPTLAIFAGSTLAAETNTLTAAASSVALYDGAFAAQPPIGTWASGDAALFGYPGPGALSARCLSMYSPGLALLEFYDSDANASATSSRFTNFSARGSVSGTSNLVVGFVVAGQGEIALLLRGVGPSLAGMGVSGALYDPAIELYAGTSLIAANDNWQSDGAAVLQAAMSAVGAFPLSSSSDAALLVTLKPGAYTLILRSVVPPPPTPANAITGNALVEIYEAPGSLSFDAATSTNALGLDVYRHLAAGTDGNLAVCPYSIESAFALAYAGAAGNTRAEMGRVLRFPAENNALISGFTALNRTLTRMAAQSIATAKQRSTAARTVDPIEWQVANHMFGQLGYPFRDTYIRLLADGFSAPLENLDFAQSPEPARGAINAWVADITRNRITDLIPQGAITNDTRCTLVNALFLKAPWDESFNPEATSNLPFTVAGGARKSVPMMFRSGAVRYAFENGTTIIAADYLGAQLQFLVLLPATGDSVDALVTRLSPSDFGRWAALTISDMDLRIPKFTLRGASLSLGDTLQALGMTTAFDMPPGTANFDGMAPRTDSQYLKLKAVYHKTFIALDEQGTEAAAATSVIVTAVSAGAPRPAVTIDRPFLFAIQERTTGVLLFLGRVVDPS